MERPPPCSRTRRVLSPGPRRCDPVDQTREEVPEHRTNCRESIPSCITSSPNLLPRIRTLPEETKAGTFMPAPAYRPDSPKSLLRLTSPSARLALEGRDGLQKAVRPVIKGWGAA